jgi:hypothetical protein
MAYNPKGFDQPVDVRGFQIHPALGHRQQYDLFTYKSFCSFQLYNGLAAGAGQYIVHFPDTLGIGNPFCLDGFGQKLLLFQVNVGWLGR